MKRTLLRILAQRRTTVILVIALVVIMAATLVTFALWPSKKRTPGPSGGAATGTAIIETGPRFLYSELQGDSTTLWLADAREPSRGESMARVTHRSGYGIKAALSPDGIWVAYTLLPPQAADPSTQASLWVTSLEDTKGRQLIEEIDLRSAPVWSSDGKTVAVRRTLSAGIANIHELLAVDTTQGDTKKLVSDDSALGLYPFAWSKDNGLLYARIDPKGTDLLAATLSGKVSTIAHLSDDIARGFSLSPSDGKVLYTVPGSSAKKRLGTVEIIDLNTRKTETLLTDPTSQYHPIWRPDGQGVTHNTDPNDPKTKGALGDTVNESLVPPPANTFDVPLAWSPDGKYLAVRSILGTPQNPSAEELTILSATDWSRHRVIASGYAEFIGWIGGN